MRKSKLGITAFDLLVAMALAVLLLCTGVPGLRAFTLNQAMQAAVAGLYTDLQFARAEALRLNAEVVACPGSESAGCAGDANWHAGWLVFADLDGNRERLITEPLLRLGPAVAGLEITSSLARNRLRFSPGGAAPGSNTTLRFCDDRGPESAREIRISASGRVRSLTAEETPSRPC